MSRIVYTEVLCEKRNHAPRMRAISFRDIVVYRPNHAEQRYAKVTTVTRNSRQIANVLYKPA